MENNETIEKDINGFGNKRKNRIAKMIVFICIFMIILYYVIKLLWYPPSSISYFYDEPENSLDIIYTGSSNTYTSFNSTLAYNLYGFTTGLLSADLQPFVLTKYMIEEAEKYQNPSLYIIDLTLATRTMDTYDEYGMRRTIDSMKFSKNRIDAINEMLSYRPDISKDKYINYYFSFLFYHNKWNDIKRTNITNEKWFYKGYQFFEDYTTANPQERYNWSEDVIELQEENKKILYDLIDYIKSNNINNVLFVIPVRSFEKKENERLNRVVEILQDNNLDVINFNTLEDFDDIDFAKDFYNSVHFNVYGATKYTLYLSKYLNENYELKNHKGSENYNSWDNEYQQFKNKYRNSTNQDFEELIN